LCLGERNDVYNHIRTKAPKIVKRLIQPVSITVNDVDALVYIRVSGPTVKYGDLVAEREQPPGNLRTKETCAAKDQHTHGSSLPSAHRSCLTPYSLGIDHAVNAATASLTMTELLLAAS